MSDLPIPRIDLGPGHRVVFRYRYLAQAEGRRRGQTGPVPSFHTLCRKSEFCTSLRAKNPNGDKHKNNY